MAKDAVLIGATDLAREVAVEVAGDTEAVGEHLSAHVEGERLVTHLFACTMPGYRGWVWSVTLARAPRQKAATVCEAHLVPADDALLAPAWIPWAERIRPGDLEPSMVLAYISDDARLVPGYEQTGEEDEDRVANWELGLGRPRVLGPEGRSDVADRWYRGSHGPTAASAIASPSPCSTCAFFIPLDGFDAHALRRVRQRVVALGRSRRERRPRLWGSLGDRRRAGRHPVARSRPRV